MTGQGILHAFAPDAHEREKAKGGPDAGPGGRPGPCRPHRCTGPAPPPEPPGRRRARPGGGAPPALPFHAGRAA